MIRARFEANLEDSRPVKYPAPYPWWESGFNEKHAVVIAYADNIGQILEYWPEAENIEYESVDKITYSDRFPKPEWYKG